MGEGWGGGWGGGAEPQSTGIFLPLALSLQKPDFSTIPREEGKSVPNDIAALTSPQIIVTHMKQLRLGIS